MRPQVPGSNLPQELEGGVGPEPLGQHLGSRGGDAVVAQPGTEDREAEKAHRTPGQVVPCRPGLDRGAGTGAGGPSARHAGPAPQLRPPSELREPIPWLPRLRSLPATGKERGRRGLLYKAE